jgi:hypothetical protein
MIHAYLCDPVTIGLAIGGLASVAGAGASLLAPKPKAPPIPTPAQPPTPAVQPATPPTNLTNTQGPSFLAAAGATPQANQPGKSLLGQ